MPDAQQAEEEWFTAGELRQALDISRATFYRWLAAGLPSIGTGRDRRFDPDAVLAWLDGPATEEGDGDRADLTVPAPTRPAQQQPCPVCGR